jgi:thiol-disulfide isomerase/thioredoxin
MIRKGFYVALLCLGVYRPGLAQDTGVKFIQGLRWREVLAEASQTGKFIFVDCYATWCGPCKMMDRTIYSAPKVSEFFNKAFISVKMQMDTAAADPEDVKMCYEDAHALKERYEVNAFPTFLFFSPDGKIVHRGLGFQDTIGLVQLGKKALESDEQFYTLWEKYKSRALSLDGMKRFASLAESLHKDSLAHSAANDYICQLSGKGLWTVDNIDFMYKFTASTRDPGFRLFRDSAGLIGSIDKKMTKAVCDGIDLQIMYSEVIKPLERSLDGKPNWKKIEVDLRPYGALGEQCLQNYRPKLIFQSVIEPVMIANPRWEVVLQLIKEQKLGESEKFLVGRALIFYEHRMKVGDSTMCREFVAAFLYFSEVYPDLAKVPQHNECAWAVFQYDNDKRDLNLALEWSKYAIDSVDAKDWGRAEYVDTYANLLYKLGRKDEALGWEEKAATLNPNPRDAEFEETLNKMKAGKPTW